jgi:hypothetical protein
MPEGDAALGRDVAPEVATALALLATTTVQALRRPEIA